MLVFLGIRFIFSIGELYIGVYVSVNFASGGNTVITILLADINIFLTLKVRVRKNV